MPIFYDRNSILEIKKDIVDITIDDNVVFILKSIFNTIENTRITNSVQPLIKKKTYKSSYYNNYNNNLKFADIKRPVLFPCNDEQKKKIIGLLNKLNNDNFDKITSQILEFLVKYDTLHFTIDTIIDVCSIQKNNCTLYSKLCKLLLDNGYDIKEYINITLNNILDSFIFNNDNINPDTDYEEFCKANKMKQKYINVLELYSILYIDEIIVDSSVFINQIQKSVEYIMQTHTCNNMIKIYIESLLNICKIIKDQSECFSILTQLRDEITKKDKYDFRTKFMISDIIDIIDNKVKSKK
jgi:hypothetical protein